MNDPVKRLAVHGGQPTFPDGPPRWPGALLAGEGPSGLEALFQRLVASGEWAAYHGPHTERLIQSVCALTNQPHARLCCSGTIAVELALRGLGVRENDEVLIGGYDFPGNFRAIEALGARPVLVDIAYETGCLDAQSIAAAFAAHPHSRVKSIIVSHLHGGIAGMQSIMEWAAQHDVSVIEDACQAPGATVDGQPAGSWGDAGVLSFGGSKLLTAGRGGAIVCRDQSTFQRMTLFSDRGNDAFPLSQLQAAVLLPQIENLPPGNALRQRNGRALALALDATEGLRPVWTDTPDTHPAGYKFGIWLCDELFDASHAAQWITTIQAEGIALDRGFRGFVKRSQRRCRKPVPLPNATRASEMGVVIHHPILRESESAIARLADAIRRATRSVLA